MKPGDVVTINVDWEPLNRRARIVKRALGVWRGRRHVPGWQVVFDTGAMTTCSDWEITPVDAVTLLAELVDG